MLPVSGSAPSRRAPTPDWYGTLEVDGRSSGANGTWVSGWAIAWLNRGQLDALAQGNRAILGFGKADYDIPLRGSAATIAKVEECVARQGRAARATAQQNRTNQNRVSNAQPTRPRPSAPQRRAPSSASLNGGPAMCDTYTSGTYACFITKLTPEHGYIDAMQLDDPAGRNPGYFVKLRPQGDAEVWVANDAVQDWDYVGFWQPEAGNGACLAPMELNAQSAEAASNLGQDAWNLCVRSVASAQSE